MQPGDDQSMLKYNLDRFVEAQKNHYADALSEIRNGEKETHWMWFIFPQIQGLGTSEMARRYAITSIEEAEAYLAHPILGPRLIEIALAMLQNKGRSANAILGSPDDMKLRSSCTLFTKVSPDGSVFHQMLDQFYDSGPCDATLRQIQLQ